MIYLCIGVFGGEQLLTNKRVLIIDDQAGIRALFREVFGIFGCEVIEAVNGYEGAEVASECAPDIIFLDMKMPGLSGIETLRILRRDKAVDVPVVLVTAYQEADMISEAERLGVAARLVKPFDVEELCGLMRDLTAPCPLRVAGM